MLTSFSNRAAQQEVYFLYLMFNLVAPASGYLLLDKHLFLKSYVWRIYQKMINWKNSEVGCVCRAKVYHRGNHHPVMYTSTFRFLYFVVSQHRTLSTSARLSNLLWHTEVTYLCLHYQSAHHTGWDKLPVCLSRPGTCLPLNSRDVGIWLTSVSLAPAHGWTFTIHALKGSHQVPWGNAQSFLEEPSPPPDFLGGPLWWK